MFSIALQSGDGMTGMLCWFGKLVVHVALALFEGALSCSKSAKANNNFRPEGIINCAPTNNAFPSTKQALQ